MKNVEIEYKAMINKEGYSKLVNLLEGFHHSFFNQTNYYFDTIDRKLKKNKINLRIRHIENMNKFIVTLKEPIKNSSGRLETEVNVSNLNVLEFPSEINELLKKYDVEKERLIEIGSLNTKRYEFKKDGITLCLDENSYLGIKDYEIECEASSMKEARQYVKKLLDDNKILYKKSKIGKQARALQKR